MSIAPESAAAHASESVPTEPPPWESQQWQEAVNQNPSLRPFFDNLEAFMELPEGVEKLRKLFLDLAVHGKLVSQYPSDGDGSSLLTEVAEDRIEYFKSRGLKKGGLLKQPSPDEFQVPANWALAHLNDLAYQIHYGYTASADPNLRDVRMLRITDIQDNLVNWETVPGCEIEEAKVAQYELADNDLLIARTGGTIGKTYLIQNVSVRSVFASYLIRVIPSRLVCAEYLKRFLECPFYWRQLLAKSAGTGQPNVNATSLKSLIVPLPPLAEQRRIVAKVESLMSLCDTLESYRRERESVRERASRSVLASLTSASAQPPAKQKTSSRVPRTETLASAWQRLSDHFEVLLDQPEDVPHLRQAILQLAVQGKLVPQDPADEPADALMEKTLSGRDDVVKQHRLRSTSDFCPIVTDDYPYELPGGWRWCRFGEFGAFMGGGTPSKGVTAYWSGDIPWVTPKDMKRPFMEDAIDHVSRAGIDNSSAKLIPAESLLMVVRGMILIHSFPVAITKRELTINQDMKALVLGDVRLARYLLLMGQASRDRMLELVQRSSHGTCRLATEDVESFVVGLPPLSEQKRIVSKVSTLLAQCDELAARLRSRQSTTDALLTALIHQILEGTP